ncbi:MAG: hypothetical protein JWM16_295 [Verrucomicrobiales bacterium]|nr:hypothetical protein [Verrucomicrobiales bacterium]
MENTLLSGQPISQLGGERHPLKAGQKLPAEIFSGLRKQAMLEGCKWDAQVGDVATLADFPLIMPQQEWKQLSSWADQLTEEALTAEREILERGLFCHLGFPRALNQILQSETPLSAEAARVMRFDFHYTTEGWRISEVNSDVPGGFTEASFFSRLMAAHYSGLRVAGDPMGDWVNAIGTAAGKGGAVALLSAPGYMEDQQVMAFLGRQLEAKGCRAILGNPQNLKWKDGQANVETPYFTGKIQAVVRFYQGEWLARLPRASGWGHFFRGSITPLANPGMAVISESKRFPLVWDHLSEPMRAWRELLPETREPRDVPWRTDDGWLLKTAMCNTGDTVSIRALLDDRQWAKVKWDIWLHSEQWMAQKRFVPLAIDSPMGRVHFCIGVYTINGRSAGCYARLSPSAVINYAAIDVPLLLSDD